MEKERLIFSIERYDHYFDSVNNKSAVFLALSTFIVSGLVASYPVLVDKVNCDGFIHSLLIVLITLGISIMIIVVRASTPFTTKEKGSLYYFNGVSSLTREEFINQSKIVSQEDDLQDLRIQVHSLANGLTSKFNKLKITGVLFIIQFSLFIPLIFLIVKNIK